jgi:hypothetical protein
MRTALQLGLLFVAATFAGWASRRAFPVAVEARAPESEADLPPPPRRPHPPTSTSDCPPVDCRTEARAAVQATFEAAVADLFDPDGAPLSWPDELPETERPEAAQAAIEDWAARCLADDAFLSVRCEEYPCTFAHIDQPLAEGCDAPWSPLDAHYVAGDELTLTVRWVLHPTTDADDPSFWARRQGRINLFVGDHVVDQNARLPPDP